MRHQFSKNESSAGGKISGTRTAELKQGIHGISPEQRLENSIRGGRTQGPIQGQLNVLSGQIERMQELPQTKIGRSLAGKRTGRALGLKYGPLADMNAIKTPESLSQGQKNGGPKSRHVRWHINRGIRNFKCSYCLAEIEKEEGWGIVVQEPGF